MEVRVLTADAEDLSINLTTRFKPQLVLDIGLNTGLLKASADGAIRVYPDFPRLAATVGVVDMVNQDCEPTTSSPQNNLIRVGSSVTCGLRSRMRYQCQYPRR